MKIKEIWFEKDQIYGRDENGQVHSQSLLWYPRLKAASATEREKYTIGLDGLHWRNVDEDISFESFLYDDAQPSAMQAFFLTHKGLPLSRCETWSTSHLHPFAETIASQRVSELLRSISESDRQRFLSLWLKNVSENNHLCYDITSISSYAQSNEFVRYGYNRDHEDLPQINMAMLFGQESKLPAYYRRMQGNILKESQFGVL